MLSSLPLNDLFFLSHLVNDKKGLFGWEERKRKKDLEVINGSVATPTPPDFDSAQLAEKCVPNWE